MRLQQKFLDKYGAIDQPLELNRFRMGVPDTGYIWLDDADAESPFTDEDKLGSPPYLVLK